MIWLYLTLALLVGLPLILLAGFGFYMLLAFYVEMRGTENRWFR